MIRHLIRDQFIPGDPAAIWQFFSSPRNLNVITPPQMRFRIVGEPTLPMYEGQLIEYRVAILPGLWTRWLTEITHIRTGEYFIDEQRIGPYRLWHHEHHFRLCPGGVMMHDDVAYDVGRAAVGGVLDRLWVSRKLRTIFDYRERKIAELFVAP